jgi:ankyrin repeat protein
MVQCLVELGGANIATVDDGDEAALHWTCRPFPIREASLDVVRYLVETCGANVEARDDIGCTALSWACYYGQLSVVQYLVEQCHANIETVTDEGSTILHDAAGGTRDGLDAVQYLVESTSFGQYGGAPARDQSGNTALHCACNAGHLKVVIYLIEAYGADSIEASNQTGANGLHYACTSRRLPIVLHWLSNYTLYH